MPIDAIIEKVFTRLLPWWENYQDESTDLVAQAYVTATFSTMSNLTDYSSNYWRTRFIEWKNTRKEN